LKCDTCGCALTATKKKGKHIYYYCTNGKGKCDEHKTYLKEEDVSKELLKMFDDVVVNEKMINMCYQANKKKLGETDEYLGQAKQSIQNSIKQAESRQNKLLDLYLDGNLIKEAYDQKEKHLITKLYNLKKTYKT